jgi:hypothetical protein
LISKEEGERVARKARATAEAMVYTLDNPYLTRAQKDEVERWFQLPGELMALSLLTCTVVAQFVPVRWFLILGVPVAVNLASGILNWWCYHPGVVRTLWGTLVHPLLMYGITLVAAVFLLYERAFLWAALVVAAKFGLAFFLEWHIALYSMLAVNHDIHFKYLFFKRYYGVQFPFEADLHL